MLMLTISLSSLSRFYRRQVVFRNTSDSCPHGSVALGIDRCCSLTGLMLSKEVWQIQKLFTLCLTMCHFIQNYWGIAMQIIKSVFGKTQTIFLSFLNYYNLIHFPLFKTFCFLCSVKGFLYYIMVKTHRILELQNFLKALWKTMLS